MTQELSRISALASRHKALGSGLEDWNGMGTAWTYNSNPDIEHNAIRESAGLFDMSGLKKIRVSGTDANVVINHIITRDMAKIYAGKSAYGSILTEHGTVCDDAIIYNKGTEWLVVHGSGETMERLQESAEGKNVNILFDDDLHNISLQGPKSLTLLDKFASIDLSKLQYFHQQEATLFGKSCLISRTGYSGERGYEIFIGTNCVCEIWDSLLSEGEKDNIMPCSFTSLDKVRIEAALLFFGYDMTAEHTPWEVGLGWTVDGNKSAFRGKEKVLQAKDKKRFTLAGLVIEHDKSLEGGEKILLESEEVVGIVNSPCWSARMQKSLALAHVNKGYNEIGKSLLVKSGDTLLKATIVNIPYYDPKKLNTHQ